MPTADETLPQKPVSGVTEFVDDALLQMKVKFPEATEFEMYSFLQRNNNDPEKAARSYLNSLRWRRHYDPPTIAEVCPHLRCRPGAAAPDGCIFLLERKGQDCARDKMGRPIIVMMGMMYGNEWELHRQLEYVLNRLSKYSNPNGLHNACTVWDARARTGAFKTFRSPDETYLTMVKHEEKYYPGFLQGYVLLCHVPDLIATLFYLANPFLPEYIKKSFFVSLDYSILNSYISNENMWTDWGGDFTFSLDEYITWRAVSIIYVCSHPHFSSIKILIFSGGRECDSSTGRSCQYI